MRRRSLPHTAPQSKERQVAAHEGNASSFQESAAPERQELLDFRPPPTQNNRSAAKPLLRQLEATAHAEESRHTQMHSSRPLHVQRERFQHPPTQYAFSPPLKRSRQTTRSTMDSSRLPADSFVSGFDHVDDVWREPLGSFADDSPQRTSSSSDDERLGLRATPRRLSSAQEHQQRSTAILSEDLSSHHEAPQNITRPYYYPYPSSRSGFHPTSHHQSNPTHHQRYGRYTEESTEKSSKWMPPSDLDSKVTHQKTSPEREVSIKTDTSTPEKGTRKAGGHPFRSPPSKLRGSPLFTASPNIGTLGSFGMDTPGGPLAADFSPMDPPFPAALSDTGRDEPPFETSLSLDQSYSREYESELTQRQPDHSPFTGFIGDFSPFPTSGGLQGVSRSPVRPMSDRRTPANLMTRPEKPATSSVKEYRSELEVTDPKTAPKTLRPSPVASEVKPRTLWNEPTGKAMRLELGHVGPGASITQRSLEGINSRMRGQTPVSSAGPYVGTPVGRPSYPPPMRHYSHQPFGHVATPQVRTTIGGPLPPTSYRPVGSATTPAMGYPPPIPKPNARVALPPGKENPKTPVATKRTPCNCKKSQCLKLYCECFSSKRYCDSCNCVNCNNLPEHENKRDKAMKETRAKNPKAFEPRITSGHNLGCKCKRSECLKKYCECFQAGVICSAKCKCTGCMNIAGSQKLIDKRRKMKDVRGAEFAMRIAEESWKSHPVHHRNPPVQPGSARQPPLPSPVPTRTLPYAGSRDHTSLPLPHPGAAMYPHYVGRSMAPPLGYSPMGATAVTPGHRDIRDDGTASRPSTTVTSTSKSTRLSGAKRAAKEPIPAAITPRTRGRRLSFDPSVSRQKRLKGQDVEDAFPFFGAMLPEQPRTCALSIFSFLMDADFFNASQVCKSWNSLAKDEELWNFT